MTFLLKNKSALSVKYNTFIYKLKPSIHQSCIVANTPDDPLQYYNIHLCTSTSFNVEIGVKLE